MNKRHILQNIESAKPEHIEWIKQGHKIMQGVSQDDLKKPVSCDDCGFGKWYQDEGFKLVNVPQLKALESLHEEIHKTYTALYYMTFDRRKKPRSTVITAGKEIPVDEKAFRREKLKQLEKKTIKMVMALNNIEKKVSAMDDQVFDSVWFS